MAAGTLARTQKKAQQEGRTLIWVDESGFYLLPALVATWAPRGETPVLQEWLTRDHLSVIGALTQSGQWFKQVQRCAWDGAGVVRFLRYLLQSVKGPLLVVWDGAPIHRSQAVKEFLRRGGAKRLQLEVLPGYAPELNPVEKLWKHLKRVELKNLCCQNLAQLQTELERAVRRLRHKKHVLHGSLKYIGFY